MGRFFVAAGRFKTEWLISAAFQGGRILNGKERLTGKWGLVYCHGNRLEIVRSGVGKSGTVMLKTVQELKTDMALIYQEGPEEVQGMPSTRMQPFFRYHNGTNWMFCYIGKIARPERISTGWHRASGEISLGELLFIYVFDRFDSDHPVEALTAIINQLREESELAFCMMSPELLAVICRTDGRSNNPARLWLGKGEMVRVICSGKVDDLPGINWEPLPLEQVIFIRRQRWAVV